jgi:hypothetical protein
MTYYGVKRVICGKESAGDLHLSCGNASGQRCGKNGCRLEKTADNVVIEGKIVGHADKSAMLLAHEFKRDRA